MRYAWKMAVYWLMAIFLAFMSGFCQDKPLSVRILMFVLSVFYDILAFIQYKRISDARR